MADSKEIVESLSNEATNSFDVSYPVLIPNMKGKQDPIRPMLEHL